MPRMHRSGLLFHDYFRLNQLLNNNPSHEMMRQTQGPKLVFQPCAAEIHLYILSQVRAKLACPHKLSIIHNGIDSRQVLA